jgi:hypothetical protein
MDCSETWAHIQNNLGVAYSGRRKDGKKDYLNASSLPEVINRSILYKSNITLTGKILEKIKIDPDMIRVQNQIIKDTKDRYALEQKAFTNTPDPELVTFGGFTNSPLNIFNKDTRNVAANELTWVLRHANVSSYVEVQKDGAMTIHYFLYDQLDLYPSLDRSLGYNVVCLVTGTIYHGVLVGKASNINAKWSINVKP